MNSDPVDTGGAVRTRVPRRLVSLLTLLGATFAAAGPAFAGGFEVGETTTKSTARGGTGVATKSDPSALYFNPALLPRADGFQVLANLNAIDMNLQFQRDDLVITKNRQEQRTSFEPSENEAPPGPVPSMGLTYDFGVDNLAVGVGLFTPSAYGERCFGTWEDGECKADPQGGARHLLVHSRLVDLYLTGGVGYQFDLKNGSLSIGASGMATYLEADFELIVNVELPPNPPWEENPENEALFSGKKMSAWNFTGVLGVAYASDGGLHFGASWRPQLTWEATGEASIDFSEDLESIGAGLTDDEITFRTVQAGSLRIGMAYADGEHPGDPDRPLYDIEVNGVWENWSAVDSYELDPAGDIEATELPDAVQEGLPRLSPVLQQKGFKDVFSLRVGGSWGALPWLTVHAGGFLETPAQPDAYTNLDFPSWERIAGSLGTSFHPTDWMDIDLAYMHVASPDRTVEDGRVFQQIPLSGCKGPDYDSDACQQPGKPPGNPQNEGEWSLNYNIASLGVTLHFD